MTEGRDVFSLWVEHFTVVGRAVFRLGKNGFLRDQGVIGHEAGQLFYLSLDSCLIWVNTVFRSGLGQFSIWDWAVGMFISSSLSECIEFGQFIATAAPF